MLSRRNIRIKVLQQLYASNQQDSKQTNQFVQSFDSIFKNVYQFYFYCLNLLIDFDVYLESERELETEKYFPNKKIIRQTRIFENNEFFKAVKQSSQLKDLITNKKLNWQAHGELFNRLYTDMMQYDFCIDYLVFDEPNSEQQKEFLTNFYEFLFNEFEMFDSAMEEDYFFWQDDSADILKAIVRTIDGFYEKNKLKLELITNKQVEDFQFGKLLFEKSEINKEKINLLITQTSPNWDQDRLTVTDMILLRMAVVEFLYFETIPLKVTINEYLDIAKAYSTPKSHLFINGVLDKVKQKLLDSNEIKKEGRGLLN